MNRPEKKPKEKMSFAIYGFGKAGRSLCASLSESFMGDVIVFSRSPIKAQVDFAKQLKNVALISDEEVFFSRARDAGAQILFIAISDDDLNVVAKKIADASFLPPVAAHLSGALRIDELSPLRHRCSLSKFHPLVSLDGQSIIPNCIFAIDADAKETVELLVHVAGVLSCDAFHLKPGDEVTYHIAATMTANLSMALVSYSQELLLACDLEKRHAQIALAWLLKSVANSLLKNDLKDSLTGPVSRGDTKTIQKHLAHLSLNSPDVYRQVYKVLSRQLLKVKDLPEEKNRALEKLLDDNEKADADC